MVRSVTLMMVSSAALLSLVLLSASGITASASVPAFVNSIDGNVYIIDTDDGHMISAIDKTSPMVGVGYITASSDGRLVFVGEREAIGVIDTAEQRLIQTIPYDNATYVMDMVAGPDGRLYVADFRRGCIAVFDARSGARLDTWQLGTPRDEYFSDGDSPVALAISPDGNMLYVASESKQWDPAVKNDSVTAFDAKNGKPVSRCKIGPMIYHMILDPDGSRLFVSAAYANGSGECLIPLATGDLSSQVPIPMPTHTWSMAFSPDGNMLYQASSIAKSVTVVDARAGSVVRTIPMPGFAPSCSVTADGGKLLVACGNAGLVAVDTSTYAVSILNRTVTNGPDFGNASSLSAIIAFSRVIMPPAVERQVAPSPAPVSASANPTAAVPTPAAPTPVAGSPDSVLFLGLVLISIAALKCRKV